MGRRWRAATRGIGLAALCAAGLVATGCKDFGAGGTGEMVIAEPRLRQIDAIDLANPPQPADATLAATSPATAPSTAPATAPAEMTLSIEQARQYALANNLDLSVELLSPTIARQTLSAEQAAFEALFTVDASYGWFDKPILTPTAVGSELDQGQLEPGIELPLQTGGRARVSAPMSRTEADSTPPTPDTLYETDAAFSLLQPLFRGAGIDSNAHAIRVAFYRYQQSEALTKLEVIRVLANADRAYWRLFAAGLELKVRRQQYDLAMAQVERAKRLEAAGQAADVEIARAESSAADRLEAIINADNALRDRQRALKRIMNLPDVEMGTDTVLTPTTDPQPVHYQLDAEQLSQVAIERRMELLDIELQLAQQAATIGLARNEALPLVSLEYTYNINGLGGSADDSFDLLAERDFDDHTLGLRMQVPIGNVAARSRLRRALSERLQLLASKAQRAQVIRQEVLTSVDQLQANWQRIEAARERVRLAERLLDVETRQLLVGQGFDFRVLEAQVNLAEAQSALIRAVADYQIAQVDIAFATGTLLGKSAVDWRPTDAPKK